MAQEGIATPQQAPNGKVAPGAFTYTPTATVRSEAKIPPVSDPPKATTAPKANPLPGGAQGPIGSSSHQAGITSTKPDSRGFNMPSNIVTPIPVTSKATK